MTTMAVCSFLRRYLTCRVFLTIALALVLIVFYISHHKAKIMNSDRRYPYKVIQKFLTEVRQTHDEFQQGVKQKNIFSQPQSVQLPETSHTVPKETKGISRQENLGNHQGVLQITKTQPQNVVNNDIPKTFTNKTSSFNSQVDNNRNIKYTKYIGLGRYDKGDVQFLVDRGQFEPESLTVPKSYKVILWYIPTRYHPKLAGLHPLRKCPKKRCRVTTNRFFYNQSDALVFTAQLLEGHPPVKRQNQTWILHNHESPHWLSGNTFPLFRKNWRSKFNWTMDYRDDADIESPYGLFRKRDGVFVQRQPIKKDYKAILASKFTGNKATVAWMVSNCRTKSKRFEYVREMRKYIKVDILGGCGKRCSRRNDGDCLKLISKHYKFYLSFENNFCKDYITEKFFRFYNTDMVLVVRGGGNYSRVAPNGTYINAEDFSSPKKLAKYLNALLKDDKRYLDILKEKDKYEPEMETWPIVRHRKIYYMTYHYDSVPMCQVCDRLWNQDSYRKHYENIGQWFSKGKCTVPEDIHVSVE